MMNQAAVELKEPETCPAEKKGNGKFHPNIALPASLEELLRERRGNPITAIIKRGDEAPTAFNRDAIAAAVKKASGASGRNYDETEIEAIVENVENDLRSQTQFRHSERTIPHVEDVQDAVEMELKIRKNARALAAKMAETLQLDQRTAYQFAESYLFGNGHDPTGDFFGRYRADRSAIRDSLVHMPYNIDISATDKQLSIQMVQKGRASKFDADAFVGLIVAGRKVLYEDAKSAVKRLERILAGRRSENPVSKEEVIALVDATLLEKGYPPESLLGGRRLNISLADIDQLIFSKSAENSNVRTNNPEAVNLGIAELALKEKAIKEVFDPEVAQAHKRGEVHLHDLGYVDRVYCSAHSVRYVIEHGLDKIVANLDSKSAPAKSPQVLNNHIHTFLAAIQSSYAGALGFPMLNTMYGPALLQEVEIVEGNQIIRDDAGNVIRKVPTKYKRKTLEDMFAESGEVIRGESDGRPVTTYVGKDGALEFEEVGLRKVLRGYTKGELKQIAQNLVFGAGQAAFSRGGQTLFTDFNIDLDIPAHVRDVPAMFLGKVFERVRKTESGEWEVVETLKNEPARHKGIMVDKGHKDENGRQIMEPADINGDVIQPEDGTVHVTYGHELVRKAALDFAEALFEVSAEGDRYGNMFNFPKIDVHVGRETFNNPDSERLLKKACQVVEKNDSIYFMYDRGDGMNVSQCCRLRERITDPEILKHPEKMRFCGFQNVSINLPQCGYRAQGESLEEKLANTLSEVEKTMIIALKAHMNKRRFIEQLFQDPGSPMYAMGGKPSDDGEPYIDLAKSTYIIGIVGLNELVQHVSGKQMHEDPGAYKIGLRILSHMYEMKNEFARRYGTKFVIEETPGESTNRRMALLDLQHYPEATKQVVKGSLERNNPYYTNSSHLTADAPISGLDRMIMQSKMNPMIEAGAITHVFTGEKENKANPVYEFVKDGYYNTQSAQVVFSGEHTICGSCGTHVRGLKNKCPRCGNEDSTRIAQKTRVVGYFSDPRLWNGSKTEELDARERAEEFYAGKRESVYDLEGELLKSIAPAGNKIRIAVLGTPTCGVCDATMKKVERALQNGSHVPKEIADRIEVVKYDITTEEGRTIASLYDAPIDTFPTIVAHQGDRHQRIGWEYPYKQKPVGYDTKGIAKFITDFAASSTS